MKGFLYGLSLQLKLDIRSKTMLITCYIVPLVFFVVMGGIFTSLNPEANKTLIESMTVFTVSMGALIGLPPSIVETYSSDIKKMYKANGIPLFLGIVTEFISAFIHLFVMSCIILIVAPLAFKAVIPSNILFYFLKLAFFIIVSLSVASLLGVLCKTQSKLTMISQIVFLPSIMLSGIMFSASLLPGFLEAAGYCLPATLGFMMMTNFSLWQVFALLGIFAVMALLVAIKLKRISKK